MYERLRDMILRLELAPGAKIDESTILRQLPVSRTPVREALVRLSSDKLVMLLPNRGAQVAPLDVLELAQYFDALELTHRAVQHWAAIKRTDADLKRIESAMRAYEAAATTLNAITMSETNMAFHRAIAAAARNLFFEGLVSQLSAHGMRLSWIWFNSFSFEDQNNDIQRTIDEHRRIFDALRRRDVEMAERLATGHVEAFRDRLYAQLSRTMSKTVTVASSRATSSRATHRRRGLSR